MGRTSGEGDDAEDVRDERHPILFEASLSDAFFEISSIRCGNRGVERGLCDDESEECSDGDEERQTMCIVEMMVNEFRLFPC